MHAADSHDRTDSALHDWIAGPASWRVALVVVGVLAVAMRMYHLGQPMRLDEARTFLDYAIRPLPDALSNYNIPNNHLLHTLLVWLSIRIFGNAEWAVRLPAFIAGVLVVPATYVTARAFADRGAALIASALAAVLPGLILYSTNARGYSMVCLAFVVLVYIANNLADAETRGRWLAFGALMTLGFTTIPAMLYPAGAVSLWLLLEHLRRHGRASGLRFALRFAAVMAVAGAVAAAAYIPAVQRFGVASITANKFVTPYTWTQFLRSLPRFAQRLRQTIGLGIPSSLLLVLALAGLLPLVTRTRSWSRLWTPAVTTAAWCIVLLVFTRRAPPPRVWLFLAPLLCIYAGIGVSRITGWLSRRFAVGEQPLVVVAALLLSLGIGATTIARRTVFNDNESVEFVAGPAVAKYLLAESRPGDRLIVSNMVSPEVDYYLYTLGSRRFGDLEAPSRSARMLIIINDRESQTPATVQAERPDVDWSRYGAPVELRKFESASVWAAPRRTE